MILSNAHTHTTFCDGKSTAEQMVQSALKLGFDALGFSSHAYTPFDDSYTMKPDSTAEYIAEIGRLKAEYRDRLAIFCGVEDDFFCGTDLSPFDYAIGSCHYVAADGVYYCVDDTKEKLAEAIKVGFYGDRDAMLEQYFADVANAAECGKYQVLGHLDLVRKFNGAGDLFDENSSAYREFSEKALKRCADTGIIIEVNTGGINRGYRSTPYPAPPLLAKLSQMGGRVMVSSDAHHADGLNFYFAETVKLLRECGFDKVWRISPQGFIEQRL